MSEKRKHEFSQEYNEYYALLPYADQRMVDRAAASLMRRYKRLESAKAFGPRSAREVIIALMAKGYIAISR